MSVILSIVSAFAQVPADQQPKECSGCAAWSTPRAPFRLFGESWYVGPDGLSAVVVRTSEGLVLLDGTLPQSVDGMIDNFAAVGLDVRDVRYVLVSHAHYDHVGGVAAIQRLSGAEVVTTGAAHELRHGNVESDDPQAGFGERAMAFPPVIGRIRTLEDGASVVLGDTTFTAHSTPGHTPGGTTWTWSACEAESCANMVYADSLNAVSAPEFRFTGSAAADELRASIAKVRALPCDVLVPVHPSFGRLFAEATRAQRTGSEAFRDRRACVRYANDAEARLDARLAEEARQP